MLFFVGLHQPSDAKHFDHACISINRLRNRKSPVPARGDMLIDSGAFTEISTHGYYRSDVKEYADALRRIQPRNRIVAAVAQDWMCEPFILRKTGLRVVDHQRETIARYCRLVDEDLPIYVLPVLQGFDPMDYRNHAMQYRERLGDGAWVGVGSICKRNTAPEDIVAVLSAIKSVRPDLRLHGFGVKKTALLHPGIRSMLYSADSMAWSFAARKAGRNSNDWHEAEKFRLEVELASSREAVAWQRHLVFA